MWKYYLVIFAALVLVLGYTWVADPCNRLARADFAERNPSFAILDSGADGGSPASVHCHVTYRKPADDEVYEDIWVYQRTTTAWQFDRVAETGKRPKGSR